MEITQGVRFDTLGLSQEMLRALEKKHYEVSTPIQAGCIPPMLNWQDVTSLDLETRSLFQGHLTSAVHTPSLPFQHEYQTFQFRM